MPHSPLERLKIADWERMINVNIKGVLYGVAAALPYMQKQKSGHFINVSSVARAVAFMMSQPDEIDVNEILFRPTRQEI